MTTTSAPSTFSDCDDPTLALRTFEGITDSAAKEWLSYNTEDITRVEGYAYGAFDKALSLRDARFVFASIKN